MTIYTISTRCPLQLLFLYRMVKYDPPMYEEGVPFPPFAQAIGWVLLCVVLCPVPLWFLYHAGRTYSQNRDKPLRQVDIAMIMGYGDTHVR